MKKYRVSFNSPDGYTVRELVAASDSDVREQIRANYVGAVIVSIVEIVS